MFPNPQDALPLPPRPNLEQYKKLAKDLLKACKSGEPDALRRWATQWVEALASLQTAPPPPSPPVKRWANEVEQFARQKLEGAGEEAWDCGLADAQFIIARCHGFESWPKFAKHLEELSRKDSTVSQFEQAADAIVSGDLAALQRLLRENPDLIRARSTREHGATLLHYVSANGVEGYRQKTPRNAVEIAGVLLQAGAAVDATAGVYGGGSTALSLTATSIHPLRAGLQNALLEVLLNHGATVDNTQRGRALIIVCLATGCQGAAAFLASRGAPLDLEGAAGVGRLDIVKSFFHPDGNLKPAASPQQLQRGFLWACEFGQNDVVEFLLQHGADLRGQADTGETGLHWAVVGGHLTTIRLLLERGAPLEELNSYGGTALGQALWSCINGDPAIDYIPIFEMLLDSGAKIEDGSLRWLAEQEGGSSLVKSRVAEVLRRHGAET
jgi:ankyrin repeat protein